MSDDWSFDAQLLRELPRIKRLLPCCPNCDNFCSRVDSLATIRLSDGYMPTTDEYCALDPERRRIPARIVAFGCPAFEPGIPF